MGSAEEGGWFGTNICNVLGDGKHIGFWEEKWIGMEALRALFPSLFCKSTQQDGLISTMGNWISNNWIWKFEWTETLTDTEIVLVDDLQQLLEQYKLNIDSSDRRNSVSRRRRILTMLCLTVVSLYKFGNTFLGGWDQGS
ncbi:putative ribonuclease H protein [Trifolium medium]|uniref:Putative ribonuclease H protein n=1 Tax=Trifolium medium TaxID=97028 RepID=A0A392MXA5_9FABA|nr:putative ribonuclease H protein [Trifolium medium]